MFSKVYLILLIPLMANLIESFVYNKSMSIDKTLIEGDILIDRNSGFRLHTSNISKRWPSAKVFYLFPTQEVFNANEKSIIRQAMDEIEKHSCVKFIESDPTELNTDDFLVITSNDGCFSSVGRIGGPQELSLESPICISKGTVLHELMHSIGFLHEQSRTDRDKFVQILWDNIDKDKQINFETHNGIIDDDMHYDFQSIMHYEFNAFSKSGNLPSIKPLNDNIPLESLGRAKILGNFTIDDIQKLNKLYDCHL